MRRLDLSASSSHSFLYPSSSMMEGWVQSMNSCVFRSSESAIVVIASGDRCFAITSSICLRYGSLLCWSALQCIVGGGLVLLRMSYRDCRLAIAVLWKICFVPPAAFRYQSSALLWSLLSQFPLGCLLLMPRQDVVCPGLGRLCLRISESSFLQFHLYVSSTKNPSSSFCMFVSNVLFLVDFPAAQEGLVNCISSKFPEFSWTSCWNFHLCAVVVVLLVWTQRMCCFGECCQRYWDIFGQSILPQGMLPASNIRLLKQYWLVSLEAVWGISTGTFPENGGLSVSRPAFRFRAAL